MTEFEKRLVRAAERGEPLVCPPSAPAVRAELIRELLLGRHGELDPRGVQIEGAHITGALDLDRIAASVGLYLYDCVIDEPIEARYAQLPALTLRGGQCAGLQADGIRIDSDLYLEGGLRAQGNDKHGLIRLVGGHIGGDLSLEEVDLTNKTGPAVAAERVHVDGSVFIRQKIRITGAREKGAIHLASARISGDLEMNDARITNLTGPAVNADDIRIEGSAFLTHGFRAVGHCGDSAVSFDNASVTQNIKLSNAEITNKSGCGFDLNSARIGGGVFFGRLVKISGHGLDGAVDVAGARIGANLELEAEVINDLGPAVNANSVDVGEGLFLHNGTQLTASDGRTGAIELTNGHIAGDLDFIHAVVTNSIGSAVAADQVHVGGQLVLRDKIRLTGSGANGAVVLRGARISRFDGWSKAELEVRLGRGPLLDLREMVIGTSVTLPPALMCPAYACAHRRWVRLDEFSYASLGPEWNWQQWLHLIRRHTPAYHASAYQRLAAVERAAGHDGTVRRILMAQQTDLRRRSPKALGGALTRWFHWLWGVLAGYGYRSRRTAAALLLVLTVAGALGWLAGQVPTRPGHLAAERVASATTTAGVPCSTVELIGLGLDRGLPLGTTGMRARCDLDTAARAGQAFTAAIWLVQLAVWGLATLALAGYTNLVRKPG
ncbi:hypothetical protein ACIA8G_14660 [Lentzea sp. NPDC051213]|uniref:hypothetical protein n=1 Tax=Lentzea sp. NPDC051213 TaxID=3364126 RepID=UPI0037A9D07C